MNGWMDVYLSIIITGDRLIPSRDIRLDPIKDKSVTAAMIICPHDDILHTNLVFCMRNNSSCWFYNDINDLPVHRHNTPQIFCSNF